MTNPAPHEKWRAHKPRKGDPVTFRGEPRGKVSSVEGSICWLDDGTDTPNCFIWCFRESLNTLHDWPAKGNPRDEKATTAQA